uniref:S-adenosylmethionine synthase n=1 Tax=Rhizophora mucronata TaxID=61149 RepID=A0A2P2J258_RHIMU
MTMLVLVQVSQATLLSLSCSMQASRMASETWSQSLSGWPSLTDSEVKRKVSISI